MRINLEGTWEISLGNNLYRFDRCQEAFHPMDEEPEAVREKVGLCLDKQLGNIEFSDTIQLPSTTEISRKGPLHIDQNQKIYLSRKYPFTGVCYYKKNLLITSELKGKALKLVLERTKFTRIFLDKKLVSTSFELLKPQVHTLTPSISAGNHEIIIEVNNNLQSYEYFPNCLYDGHQFSEHTQTNWNGIMGDLYLKVIKPIQIEEVVVKKGKTWKEVILEFDILNPFGEVGIKLLVYLDGHTYTVDQELINGINQISWIIHTHKELKSWDEFNPVLYELQLAIVEGSVKHDSKKIITGFRDLLIKDKGIWVNGNRIFLRGNIDCAIYPKTGAVPMTVDEWRDNFKILQEYGMNHCRFHSWCPPEAAFIVADEMGIYLQVELSCFAVGFYTCESKEYDKVLNDYLYDQSVKVVKAYGNHPSFIMFAVGNEMHGDLIAFEQLLKYLKTVRDDLLYSQGANNFLDKPVTCSEDEYWIIMRTTEQGNNIRASFSNGDLPLGHIQTEHKQGTYFVYDSALEHSNIPLISHEVGQYQVYPDFKEIEEYTGITYPSALIMCKERLAKKGMENLSEDFFIASGLLAVQCYKEDIESILRTDKMSGFQLLSLHDFPGQGTALVGVLNSFMESKGLITPKKWREFCNDQIIFAKLRSYTYNAGETIQVQVGVYNYGNHDIENEEVTISLIIDGVVIEQKSINNIEARRGKVTNFRAMTIETSKVKIPTRCELIVQCSDMTNSYPIWIYPMYKEEVSEKLYVTDVFDNEVENNLVAGKNVLLFSNTMNFGIEAGFATDFWCYPMFMEACDKKGMKAAPGTMGLLIDNEHKSLKHFPTETYSSWQWQQIVSQSKPVILDDVMDDTQMIVQVIDNFDRNHRLGLIYEKSRHNGKLIICTMDVLNHQDIPEVRQLYNSLVCYGNS